MTENELMTLEFTLGSYIRSEFGIFTGNRDLRYSSKMLCGDVHLDLDDISNATILTIVVIPLNPMDITTNLRGPLVINPQNNKAKQLVLIDDRYHTKHLLLRDVPPELMAAQSEAVSGQR